MAKPETITRAAFIKRYMEDCGLTYQQSCQVYDCMVSTIQDGVVTGTKINFGRLGTLAPRWLPARAVNMGFERRANGEVKNRQRTYFLGRRISYSFRLYREFMQKHRLDWFSTPDADAEPTNNT